MQKWVSSAGKYFTIAAALLVVAFLALVFLIQPKPVPPLPFDTNAFVSTTKAELFKLPPNPTLSQRIRYWIFTTDVKLRGNNPTTWSFPASPASPFGVQPLLNQCTEVSGNCYLIPKWIAAGVVTFGHTNVLDGPQFIKAAENALQQGDAGWWDSAEKGWRKEPLVFVRFPRQKVIVVLPKSKVADFLRTNEIDPARFPESR